MIGLFGMALGLYGAYEMAQNVKTTKQDLSIKQGTGSIYQQKRNIDNSFLDILEYSGAKCKIVRDTSRTSQYKRGNIHYKIIDAQPNEYGGMELYLMQKGYSKEAIEYCKSKFDFIANNHQQKNICIKQNKIKDYENALHNSREMAVSFYTSKYNDKNILDKDINQIIKYLHKNGNPNARVNVIVNGTTHNYKFEVTWVLNVPYGYNPHEYIENVEQIVLK